MRFISALTILSVLASPGLAAPMNCKVTRNAAECGKGSSCELMVSADSIGTIDGVKVTGKIEQPIVPIDDVAFQVVYELIGPSGRKVQLKSDFVCSRLP